MNKRLKISDSSWRYGSYPRKDFKNDSIYKFYQYMEVSANRIRGEFHVTDAFVEELLKLKMISLEKAEIYRHQLSAFFAHLEEKDEWPAETVFGAIRHLRSQVIGNEVLENYKQFCMHHAKLPAWNEALKQEEKKEEVFQKSQSLMFALCEPQWFDLMRRDVIRAIEQGKHVYLLCGAKGESLPTEKMLVTSLGDQLESVVCLQVESEDFGFHAAGISWDEKLQSAIEAQRAGLFFYGEEGLLQCKNLKLPSIVHAVPNSYFAKAVTNQFGNEKACMVYVPAHWNILSYVSLTAKTKISYWHLARMWEMYGDDVYKKTVEEMYLTWPQCFLNIYESGVKCQAINKDYPIQVKWDNNILQEDSIYGMFYQKREEAIGDYLNQTGSFTYLSGYFDEQLKQSPFSWKEMENPGILVHGIKTGQAQKSKVMDVSQSGTLRQVLEEKNVKGLQLFSNFLFFLTPKIAQFYNKLRADRPREQIDFQQGHVDYFLSKQEEKRVETFPLYKKACIAMKEDGSFVFFNHSLGGGRLNFGKFSLQWKASDVNRLEESDATPVAVYTPFLSQKDVGAGNEYVLPVGEGRLNLVIIQDEIICMRKGEVLLPCIGVVLSLSEEMGEAFLKKMEAKALENGYYACDHMEFQLELERPMDVPEEAWKQVIWSYGGGMTLFKDGKNLFPMDYKKQMKLEESWLFQEGWMSPLSRQTQESEIHKLTRHPRTAIGVTKGGELFVLVYSGRTAFSGGADYCEMCRIAEQLIPDIEYMMNVDGGGSSVLGISLDGNFMELSYPATSKTNVAGMVRKINTVLCLEQ